MSAAVAMSAAATACGGASSAHAAVTAPIASDSPAAATTRVLAIGSLTAKATPAALPPVLELEVPATVRLYLAGKIAEWYAKSDQTGVVFILDVTSIAEARALLETLPLGQAGMMTFEFTPVGPLRPLGMLLGRLPSK